MMTNSVRHPSERIFSSPVSIAGLDVSQIQLRKVHWADQTPRGKIEIVLQGDNAE